MASDLDATVLKRTQNTLGKFVKRPALTDKLLRKPPFRFLHDIVHAIIREHGLLEGLYTADELNSDNIKDRDSKMAFLQKLIDVVKLTTDRELKVRPSKIVAGLEPERTNELLQALATALENKLNINDLVRQYLADNPKPNGPTNDVPPPPPPATNGDTTKVETREETKKAGKQEKSKDKPKEKETIAVEKRKEKISKVSKEKDVIKNGSTTVQQQVENRSEKGKPKQNGTKASTNDSSRKKTDKPSKGKEKEKTLKRISSIPEEQYPVVAVPEKPAPIANGLETVANGIVSHENRKRKDSLKEFGEPVTLPDANGEENAVPSADEDQDKRKQSGSNSSSRRSSLKKQNSLTPSENNALSEMNQFNGLHSSLSRQDSNGAVVGPDAFGNEEAVPPADLSNRTEITVTAAPAESKSSAKPPMHRQQSVETVMRPRTSLRPPSVRPPSARPGAPRRKEKNVEVILQPNETQKLGEINVKMEVFNSELLDDDGENLIVIEDPSTITDEIVYGRVTTEASGANEEPGRLQPAEQEEQQGHLVQQILETQKEFSSHTGTSDSELLRKADMEWTAGQRQSSAKQMESLRESIQKLTRSVNPLGKLMDFIQEDIDSMERELASWQQIYTQSMVELNKERSATENAIEPLKQQLQQIDVNIKEYRDMIDTTRANILQNEAKIERLYMTEI
ncbi:TRAF3-interacting protein 1 [Anopheles maculipalpis]|uniref:TRAF3-interacting protein 1 n=1 Tax=Anopheles maculipalpis TaxID=1496333 RepID=UPI0021591998|nr:TRAF3-interacting protein 1 [Anopheles maculipalpis]